MPQKIITKKINNLILKIFILTLSISLLSACSSQVKKPNIKNAAEFNAQLGARYLQAGRLKLANEKLSKALEQNPNSSEVNHYFAILQQRIGDNKAATKYFKKAINIDHDNPRLLNNYGTHLCQIGKYAKAVEQFNLAVKSPYYQTPEFAYTNAGICLQKNNDSVQAESYFRKALNKNTNFGSALFQMAKLNYHQGNFAKAQAFLLRYNENNPDSEETLSLCSAINTRLGDLDKANACSEKRLRLLSK